MKREAWFGLIILFSLVATVAAFMPAPADITDGHLGLLMLALVVVAIMLGFPTAFTLMGMGVIFAWFAFHSRDPEIATQLTLNLMVQRAYSVMANDVLISIPLFIFMGYLVERANLIEQLFKSLHIALARIPGSLAVASIVTCAVFATATGIVGAVVTLMGLLALPAMLKSGYSTQMAAGSITAGGCLGILIPPSVLLIVYGATAGVSVVKLYAGAFFPGILLTVLYIGYVVLLAKIKPALAPPLAPELREVKLPQQAQQIATRFGSRVLPALLRAIAAGNRAAFGQLGIALLPALAFFAMMAVIWHLVTAAPEHIDAGDLDAISLDSGYVSEEEDWGGLAEPPGEDAEDGSAAAPQAPPQASAPDAPATAADAADKALPERLAAPNGFWWSLLIGVLLLAAFYAIFNFARLEIFKMLLGSLFPLALLVLAVLGSIVFGLATPTEAAAMGAFGGIVLAACYRRFNYTTLRESAFLAAKTSAMVCWLFVGSAIFSAAFALLGGQEIVNNWVLGMDLTPVQFMLLAQVIIFLLGWPLEWTEIIVIFMPIFIPLLPHFGIDPLFFGLLVALNLQTAFLSPPVAMSAFYLKGVAPPHVTLNQIFLGMMPFMGLQILALIILYMFPGIGLWLPGVLYN